MKDLRAAHQGDLTSAAAMHGAGLTARYRVAPCLCAHGQALLLQLGDSPAPDRVVERMEGGWAVEVSRYWHQNNPPVRPLREIGPALEVRVNPEKTES